MTTAMWIAASILFVSYTVTGLVKLVLPVASIPRRLQWVHATRPRNVRAMGVVNLLGGLGVMLPPLTGMMTWLTIVAAVGLVIVQAGAIRIHIAFRDFVTLPVNILLLLLAAYLALALVIST